MNIHHLNIPEGKQVLSLYELNRKVKVSLQEAFAGSCWIQAETSDVRANVTSGHCYLEFIEKHPVSGQIMAKARGTVWANVYRMLKPYFEQETGQTFTSGIKVLVKVNVDYHEVYGFNLTVIDIDPTYTLGDMAKRRMEIIRKLREDGVFTLNKELPFPLLPQRIAVITSPTAAGYEDFQKQLADNKAGFPFYVKLFPAVMQGEKTEISVIAALDHVYHSIELFDLVVIIRGGGATSDLSSFDSYLLAANCAQFPLPIITGIGHERDDTVVDMVAHERMKTPTAVAEFLIGRMQMAAEEVEQFQLIIRQAVLQKLADQAHSLQLLGNRLPSLVNTQLERSRTLLSGLTGRLPATATGSISKHTILLESLRNRLSNGLKSRFAEDKKELLLFEQFIKMASPDYVLKRGYTLTFNKGKIIKRSSDLQSGDEITTRFADGEVSSNIL